MTAVSLLARLLPALLAIATALPATAQDYPTKPIRFTICCAPGGSADLVTRLLAEKMATLGVNEPLGKSSFGLE